jgi:hypothetical protein
MSQTAPAQINFGALPEIAPASDTPRSEILFFDSAIADPSVLLSGVSTGIETVLLNPARDGLQQIADALALAIINEISGISSFLLKKSA